MVFKSEDFAIFRESKAIEDLKKTRHTKQAKPQ